MAAESVGLFQSLERLLERRWDALWARLAAPPGSHPPFGPIADAYGSPARYYHTLRHLGACLAEFDAVRSSCEDPDAVEVAIWFHDLVYDPSHDDNEERSAAEAGRALERWGAGASFRDVVLLVLATAHRAAPATADEKIITDIDLAILGKSAEEFDEYEGQIRLEYAHVPDEAFAAGRARILRRFLDRPHVYQTAEFRERYEAAARANLRRSLASLASRL